MADTGMVVVPAPSAKQQTTDKSALECATSAAAHRLDTSNGSSTNPPLQPIHETNQHPCNSSSDIITAAVAITKSGEELAKQHPVALNSQDGASLEPSRHDKAKSLNATIVSDAPEDASSACEIKRETNDDIKRISVGDSCASSQSVQVPHIQQGPNTGDKEPSADERMNNKRKLRDVEETIIDNFAICAFATWEDLQDEINERIALERAKQKSTASEKRPCDKSPPKKRSRPKKEKSTLEAKSNQDVPGPHNWATKPKKIKSDKKHDRDRNKKESANGQSSELMETSKTTASTTSAKKAVNSVTKKLATGKESSNGGKSEKLPNDQNHDSHTSTTTPINQIGGTSVGIRAGDKAKLSNHDKRVGQAPIRGQDLPQAAPYSPYGSNPHLDRLHDITTGQSMQGSYPVNFHDQKQSISQSQQPNKPNPPPILQAPSKPGQHNHHYQTPYHSSSFMYPPPPHPTPPTQSPRQSSPSANPTHHYNYYSTHNTNPYFYPAPTNIGNQHPNASGYPPQPSYASQPIPRSPYYGQYQSPQHIGHPNTISQPSHLPAPYSMYSQHLGYPQHSSSMMSASLSMSTLPSTYGTPYVVTDTTISRQTSIVPPMPTAFDQAGASSVASRFGHHNSLMHPVNHRGTSVAMASHRGSNPLFQSATERSFMELAKSYSSTQATSASYPSYAPGAPGPSPALPATPAPSLSSTPSAASPYSSLDRWPRMSVDYAHDRVTHRFNGLYSPSTPTMPPYGGAYGMRPPPFPNPMLFANIDAQGP